MKHIQFDLLHLYYLPQLLNVARLLTEQGVNVSFVIYAQSDTLEITQHAMDEEELDYKVVQHDQDARSHYRESKPDWIFFGNAPDPVYCELQQAGIKLAFMQHGIGPKSCYYTSSEFPFDVRFVEGQMRKARLEAMYPTSTFIDTGYAKLDPLFNNKVQLMTLASIGLDPNKPTLLYAPTFYPSSIECFDSDLPKYLADYNLIVKPHFFSLIKKKYAKQRALFDAWAAHANVYLAPVEAYSLLPFMQVSDVLLSEASSTVFEFAALDKPVVWCDFYKVRWTYRGPFKFRLGKRLDEDLSIFYDLSDRAKCPKELLDTIKYSLANKQQKSAVRKEITLSMTGKTDGLCSQRIVEYIMSH